MTDWKVLARAGAATSVSRCPEGHIHVEYGAFTLKLDDPHFARMIGCLDGLRRVGSRKAVLVHAFNVEQVGGLYESLAAAIAPQLEHQRGLLAAAGFEVTIEAPLGLPFHEINRLPSAWRPR